MQIGLDPQTVVTPFQGLVDLLVMSKSEDQETDSCINI